jgi:hypothetical protein
MFLELWKRRQSVIAWEWDLRDFEDFQHTRPEFESKVKTTRYKLNFNRGALNLSRSVFVHFVGSAQCLRTGYRENE